MLGAALPSRAQSAKGSGAPVILVVGDSLSAEYGLARGTGWVTLLEQRLDAERIGARVINASISGDTTAGGLARLPALLQSHRPTHVIVELGGNDALRGLPLVGTERNLSQIVQLAQQAGTRVLLVGMQIPPNFGADYARRFSAVFETVARQRKAALVPFFLQGVADGPDPTRLFQPDRIHPTAQAQPLMLDNVWPHLQPLLR
nr:arylesterase [Melaminivora sp.]